MKVRIISGEFGGRNIEGSSSDKTHPMGERVRNSLFNIIGSEIDGAAILDAYAGSGSIGFEALSRGASRVVFVERDRDAQAVIAKNATLLGLNSEKFTLEKKSVSQLISGTTEAFDIIFADPPYNDLQLSTTMQLIGLLKPNGLMVLSYPSRSEVPTKLGVVVVDNRSYGNASLAFYRREDAE